MPKITTIDVFLRLIPETFLIVFGIFSLSFTPINKKKYFTFCGIVIITVYLVRKLPIEFGIHTILIIMTCILVAVYIVKIPVMKSIHSVLLVVIILSICEWLNIVFLSSVLKMDMPLLLNNSIRGDLAMLPSLMLFTVVLFIYKASLKRSKVKASSKK